MVDQFLNTQVPQHMPKYEKGLAFHQVRKIDVNKKIHLDKELERLVIFHM